MLNKTKIISSGESRDASPPGAPPAAEPRAHGAPAGRGAELLSWSGRKAFLSRAGGASEMTERGPTCSPAPRRGLKGQSMERPVVGARRGWAGRLRVSRGGLRGAASLAPRRVLAEPGAEGGQTRPPARQRRGKGHHGAPRPSSGAACEASSSWETRTGCCAGPRGPAPPQPPRLGETLVGTPSWPARAVTARGRRRRALGRGDSTGVPGSGGGASAVKPADRGSREGAGVRTAALVTGTRFQWGDGTPRPTDQQS